LGLSEPVKKILLYGAPTVIVGLTALYLGLKHAGFTLGNPTSEDGVIECQECATDETAALPSSPLDMAITIKNRGNKNFKVRRYAKAVECYTEALAHCPEGASAERSTFYQNRAAAKENLQLYDEAIEDCTAALELSPRYIKALARRASLYERLNMLQNCLLDATAACILERFQNSDNVMRIDRVLKALGTEMAKEEREKLPRSLPSSAFISNYLRAFAWNPFSISDSVVNAAAKANAAVSEAMQKQDIEGEEKAGANGNSQVFNLPESLLSAYESLDKALELMDSEIYEASMQWAKTAVKQFNSSPKVSLVDFAQSSLREREQPIAAKARALLIDATFKALSGCAEVAKAQFIDIGEEMYAQPSVRVNALIKAASLTMTVNQDLGACLHLFQQAQTVCPDCPDVYLHRGQIHLLADQLEDALLDLSAAVKLKPDFSVAQSQRLYTLYRRDLTEGKSDKAEARVQEFARLVEKFPNCLESHSLYAQVLTERGEFQQSDVEFGHVIKLAPSSGMAYAHKGLLQLRWKMDQNAAAEWFRKGIEVDPKCELALELLGQLSMERGNFTEALDYFNRAIQLAKTAADLAHLISLREGVKTQVYVCEKYSISVSDMFSSLQQELQSQMTPI